jgi:hypothetical protein
MSDFDNTNSGALFKNDRKRGANSPDFKGQCEPVCPHCGAKTKFWLSAWKKLKRGGGGFLSLAFTADETQETPDGKVSPKPEKDDFDFDDDIPF